MFNICEKIKRLYYKVLDGDEDVLSLIRTEIGDENLAIDECLKILEAMADVIGEIESEIP